MSQKQLIKVLNVKFVEPIAFLAHLIGIDKEMLDVDKNVTILIMKML